MTSFNICDWLLASGIQCQEGPDKGGVYAWIDESTGRPSYLYTEAAGYLVTLLSNLAAVSADPRLQPAAKAAGDWISSVAMQTDGSVLTRKYPDNGTSADPLAFSRGVSVFFDSSIAGYGLLNLYRLTLDDRYLANAELIARKCLVNYFDEQQNLRCVYFNQVSGTAIEPGDRWSQQCGAYNLKAAFLFAELERITGAKQFLQAAENLLQNALSRYLEPGRFICNDRDGSTQLHPHLYAVEGLAFLSRYFARKDLLDYAVSAIDYAFDQLVSYGTASVEQWPECAPGAGNIIRSDTIAQCLRAYYISRITNPSLLDCRQDTVAKLHEMLDACVLASGGTSYGRLDDGSLVAHSNAWCQFFRLEMELFRHCYESGTGFPSGVLRLT